MDLDDIYGPDRASEAQADTIDADDFVEEQSFLPIGTESPGIHLPSESPGIGVCIIYGLCWVLGMCLIHQMILILSYIFANYSRI